MAFGRGRGGKLGEGVSLGIPRDENQLLTVLERLGIDVEDVSEGEVRVLCPFHGNSHSSAMSVSIPTGMYNCFNPMCSESGTLLDMVVSLKRCDYFTAVRFIDEANSGDSFQVSLISKKKDEDLLVIDPEDVARWHYDLVHTPEAVDYLHKRGITDESINKFNLGYSTIKNFLITPVYDAEGATCIGGIGRGLNVKDFKNIPGTKTSRSLFNIHNAKKHSTIIIVESNFDAIRVHQAGFPGVVATCGGIFSDAHLDQIAYYAERVIIMTDVDGKQFPKVCNKCTKEGRKYCVGHDPGRDLGAKIARRVLSVGVTPRWAYYGECGTIYPEGAKDAGDMTDQQIRDCINNSVSNFEYNTL